MTTYRIHAVGGEIRSASMCSTGLGDPEPVAEGEVLDIDLPRDEPMPSSDTHHVVAGALMAYTPEQRTAKAQRPRWPARWDNTSMSWVDLRTPEDIARIQAAQVDVEIQAVERLTARALREAVLAVAAGHPVPPGALARLTAADAEIREARARRPPLGDMPQPRR